MEISPAMAKAVRRVRRVVAPLLFAYLSVVVMLSLVERWLVYPAPRSHEGDWIAAEFPHEDIEFAGADGAKLHGWYIPHPAPKAVVLFCHGNGENVATLRPLLEQLHERTDVAIFVWDYRGYGKSQGKPQESNLLADARAAQLVLAKRAGIEPSDVVVYGRSLGGAVAVGLAAEHPVRGMVLERTFADMVETAAYHFPWLPVRWVMKNRYPSIERIVTYRGPLFQSHGTADEVVPFAMGKKLFDAATTANKTFFVVEEGSHNAPQPPEYYKALGEFFDSLPAIGAGQREHIAAG
ncbi:Alpha/beta hydrolase family protein [Lacipirellula limnantheis]|uniref:Alpha/beta hydrolase family protein n=2 Tax=Lacipirellula limnantheis TaxID=2528024 RepID=A0A517U420_9BACT|nr:Alpha/beta hydrolase family protein [Lacipirellula limnantheis]